MTIRATKLTFGLILIIGLICPLMVHAQTLPFIETGGSGSTAVDFEFRLDGTFIENGIGASPNLPENGMGTRMFWYPAKAAFRAGSIGYYIPTAWDLANIGTYSVAFNQDTKASGSYSAAFGQATQATGNWSVAFGQWSSATGGESAAFGNNTSASGGSSVAFGSYTQAGGNNSAAFGQYTYATGTYATDFGYSSNATAYESFVIGQYNLGGGTANSWVATDPIFEIGNGTSSVHGDALLVDKSGNVTATTFVTKAAAGDIPMFTGY